MTKKTADEPKPPTAPKPTFACPFCNSDAWLFDEAGRSLRPDQYSGAWICGRCYPDIASRLAPAARDVA